MADIFFEESFEQLCLSRKRWPDRADLWHLLWLWKDEYERLNREFVRGSFRFGLRRWIILPGNREVEITDARDALAERLLTGILKSAMSDRCFHPTDKAGIKAVIQKALGKNRFIFRTITEPRIMNPSVIGYCWSIFGNIWMARVIPCP